MTFADYQEKIAATTKLLCGKAPETSTDHWEQQIRADKGLTAAQKTLLLTLLADRAKEISDNYTFQMMRSSRHD